MSQVLHGAAARSSAARHVLGAAADAARTVGDDALARVARHPFQMAHHPAPVIDELLRDMRAHLAWIDEGNCYNRAMYGAHLLAQRTGIGTSPLADTFAAAIAVSPHLHTGGGYTGGFHAALAVRIQGRAGIQIIDPLPGNVPIRDYATWLRDNAPINNAATMSAHPEQRVLRPWAGTGLWDGMQYRSTWVGAPYFEDAARRLEQAHTAMTARGAWS